MNTFAPLAEGRHPKHYLPGQMIYLQDSPADEFYYLIQGAARSFISSPAGGERVLTIHHSGDLMGEASFFDQCPRVSSAVAVSECDVISIDRASLDRILRERPELAIPMLQYLARTVRLLSHHMDEVTFLPAEQRLARYLLSEAAEGGPFHCTHEELGYAIGVSRVTISRLMAEFARCGILRTGYRSVTILDTKALQLKSKE